MMDDVKFGARFSLLLEMYDSNTQAIAEELGYSVNSVYQWRCGKRKITISTLYDIVKKLNVTQEDLYWLITGDFYGRE